jgi:hypothetical protein
MINVYIVMNIIFSISEVLSLVLISFQAAKKSVFYVLCKREGETFLDFLEICGDFFLNLTFF